MATHGVVLTTAVAVAFSLPLIAAMVLRTGDPAVLRSWIQRSRSIRPTRHEADVLTTGLEDIVLPDLADSGAALPPIGQVAVQLQRLYRHRMTGTARGSVRLHTAYTDAYDAWLQVACRHYHVRHHFGSLTDMDRDLERVRVEEMLTEAGFHLPPR